MDDHRWKRQ